MYFIPSYLVTIQVVFSTQNDNDFRKQTRGKQCVSVYLQELVLVLQLNHAIRYDKGLNETIYIIDTLGRAYIMTGIVGKMRLS